MSRSRPESRRLRVPGGELWFAVRGSGPLLLLIGAPLPGSSLGALARALARHVTAVTYDPPGPSPGVAGSGAPERSALAADQAAALLDALDAGSTDVFGSCVGAVTGLSLAERYPGRIRTLLAHEPPLPELLPEAAATRRTIDDIVATLRRDGVAAAWQRYLDAPEFRDDVTFPAVPGPRRGHDTGAAAAGHEREMRDIRHLPDGPRLRGGPTRIVVGVGADTASGASDGLPARSAARLAALLGTSVVEFPGGHTGFLDRPAEFAESVRRLLTQPPR